MFIQEIGANLKHYKELEEANFCPCDRQDTAGYIRWYIKHAYQVVTGDERPATKSPHEDIEVMYLYWSEFFFG